ncbi:hypothetical protein EVJ58_g6460 [Rhodofomes roseus]|uniref:Reverse transcriptase n=1 Tax=Rhodofomes roseus TaxID=34475 RepID=A0A4Y9YBZ5_9APHY|nr:hypothetical protein EVJ58_g6460 [Rhodofomes roseus]
MKLINFLHTLNQLASMSEQMATEVAILAPQRFEGYAKEWWSVLDPEVKRGYLSSWWLLREGLRRQFFTAKFMEDLRDIYDRQTFRESGHERELPGEFIIRRIVLHEQLHDGPRTVPEIVRAVIKRAPALWSTILNAESLPTLAALLQQAQDKAEDLIHLAAIADRQKPPIAPTREPKSDNFTAGSRRFRAFNRKAYAAQGEEESDTPDDQHDFASYVMALDEASLGRPIPSNVPTDFFPPPLASAAQAQAQSENRRGANRRRPAAGYFRPRNDTVVSKKLPPSPCKVCGSEKHWDRECPHWSEYVSARAAQMVSSYYDIHPTDDHEYAVAFLAYVYDENHNDVHALSQPAAREPRIARPGAVSMEEEEEPQSSMPTLPPDHPSIFIDSAEDPEAARRRTDRLAERIDTALRSADEELSRESIAQGQDRATPTATANRAGVAAAETPASSDSSSQSPPAPRIISLSKAHPHQAGHSTVGITALTIPVRLATPEGPAIAARVDSGADISLISAECLASIPQESRPRIKKGLRMKLFQLTNGFHIEGFVQLPILVEADDGDWLSMEGEFYVVPGMNSPILLGEDFQVNYELSTLRRLSTGSTIEVNTTGHTFPAQSTSRQPTREFGIIGKGAEAKFVRAKSHRRNQNRRRRRQQVRKNPTAIVSEDCTIGAHACRAIPIIADFSEGQTWFAEKTVLGQADGSMLLTTPTLLDEQHAYIAVSNTTDRPVLIRKGEVLAPLRAPDTWFEREEPERLAHAHAVRSLIQAQMDQEKSDEQSAEPDRWGPNTAELPDPTIYPSDKLEELLDIGPEWPAEERAKLIEVLRARQQAFAFDGRLGHNPTEVEIKTAPGSRPVSLPMYAASPAKREVIDKQHDAWLALDVIEPSNSPWAAPVLIAYRNGKPRFCVDYRRLNTITVPDEFPIPRQTEILQALSGAQVLSSLDALSGFTQLTVAEADREKTAFRTHRGLFQFKRLPFGLRNGPSAFQRVMQGVLAPYLWLFTLVYIDDVVVYSKSWQEHVSHLDKVLAAVIQSGLTLSPTKCHFGYSSILLLGQKVSQLGFSTHEEKVRAVTEFARPSKVAELQSFLGMAVYFSNYIPYYSFIASPLFQLLRKDTKWKWTAECEHAWQAIKAALQNAPVLAHAQPGYPYRLYTDASDVALGACLQQVQLTRIADLAGTRAHSRLRRAYEAGQAVPTLVTAVSSKFKDIPETPGWNANFEDTLVPVERVIAYWSRSCKPAERNYSATEREALAAKEGLVHFLPFVEGEQTTLVTDHAALQWARTFENANRRLAAWGAVFSAFAPNLDIVHRAGRVHSNVDPLSRIPRSPPNHDSPVTDPSQPIRTDDTTAQAAEDAARKRPAEKSVAATQKLYSWAEVLEDTPSLAYYGSDVVQATGETRPAASSNAVKTRRQAAAEREQADTPARSSPPPPDQTDTQPQSFEDAPYAVLLDMSEELAKRFVDGYQADRSFKDKWAKASQSSPQAFKGQCFTVDERGLLYMRVNDEPAKLCVPKSLVPVILTSTHDSPIASAHEGPRKLIKKLNLRFYWPTLRRDAETYARTCDVCQKTKVDRRAPAGMLRPNPIPGRPYQWVSMDLITGLPESEGFNAIFVTVCCLTKHVQSIPCRNTLDTTAFAKLFVNHVILKFGMPEHIISDRDPRWTSDFWRAVAHHLKLHLSLSSAHHPQHDGQTEIANQTIETMLRAYVHSDRKSWAHWLPMVCHAYNSSIHSATGYSPYFLLYGMEPTQDLDFLARNTPHVDRPRGPFEHAQNFVADMQEHREKARVALAVAQEQMARAYNNGRRPEQFEVGSKVLVNPHSLELVDVQGTGKKLVQRMLGPFTVQERINPLVYKLALPDTYPMNPVLNIEHLRQYREDTEAQFSAIDRPTVPDPRHSDLLASQEWEVEDIIGWRRNRSLRNRLEFLIRWKGYGPTEDSWVSEFDLRNARDILRDFQAKNPTSKG